MRLSPDFPTENGRIDRASHEAGDRRRTQRVFVSRRKSLASVPRVVSRRELRIALESHRPISSPHPALRFAQPLIAFLQNSAERKSQKPLRLHPTLPGVNQQRRELAKNRRERRWSRSPLPAPSHATERPFTPCRARGRRRLAPRRIPRRLAGFPDAPGACLARRETRLRKAARFFEKAESRDFTVP